jgi:DUF1365 family protein
VPDDRPPTQAETAIYRGTLTHRRFRPARHQFTYPLFMVLLDIDRIAETMSRSRLSSYNRWNWASFDDRDHFGDPRRPLRERVAHDAATNGIALPDGRIFLLTHLRYLGYCFNPVSFYYCYDRRGILRVMLAEVNNTYGGTQNYWLSDATRLTPPASARTERHVRHKAMYVSPFNQMDQRYTFAFTQPAERLVAHMRVDEKSETVFDATLTLRRDPWTASTLRGALCRHPWMTAKVIAAIHWQALRVYWRGVPVVRRPPDNAPEVAGRRVLGAGGLS